MAAGANLDWLYCTLGWVIGGAAMALFAWALFHDRSRGRKRCPKCWYDMAGVPGFRCPECGREAKRERQLTRTRRRKWWAGFAVVSMGAGLVVHQVPEVAARGWKGAVPTTVLILGLPWLELPPEGGPSNWTLKETLYAELMRARLQTGRMFKWQQHWMISRMVRGDRLRPLNTDAWRNSFGEELSALCRQNDPERPSAGWPAREVPSVPLVNADLWRMRAVLIAASIRTRSRWPQNTPVYACIDEALMESLGPRQLTTTAHLPGAVPVETEMQGFEQKMRFALASYPALRSWTDTSVPIGTTAGPQPDITLSTVLRCAPDQSDPRVLFEGLVHVPIRVGGSIDDVIRPIRSPDLETELRSCVTPVLSRRTDQRANGRTALLMLDLGEWRMTRSEWGPVTLADLCSAPKRLTLGLRIEVLRDHKLVAVGRKWWKPMRGPRFGPYLVPGTELELDTLDPSALVEPEKGTWEVKFIGDGEISLRDFESEYYWQGELVLPAKWR